MYKEILVGEYSSYFIDNDGEVSTYDNNKLVKYNMPSDIVTGSAGHPWACVIDLMGWVYHILGDNTQVKKTTITGAASSTSFYTHHVVVGKDGSLTAYTDDLKTVKIPVPGKIEKAVAASDLLVLDDKGGVWKYEWIASGKIVKPHADLAKLAAERIPMEPATDIATSRSMFSAAIVGGKLIVWCDAFGAPFIGQNKATNPIKPDWKINKLGKPLKKVFASDNVLYVIDGDDELWGMGNNWCGQVGNGQIHPAVLAGNADMGNRLFVPEPVKIGRGKKWKKVWVGTYYGFRTFAQDMEDNIYSWGYGKFGLLSNGIKPQDDVKNVGITAVTIPWYAAIPPTLRVVPTTSFKRNADGTVTAEGKPYPPIEPSIEPVPVPNKPPVVNAGQDIEVTLPVERLKLSAEAMDSDGTISSYAWTQVNGSGIIIENGDTATPEILIKEVGDYEFEVVVKDDKGLAAKDSVKVRVNPKQRLKTHIIHVYDNGEIEVEMK